MSEQDVRINGFHKYALLSVAFAVDFLQFIFVFIPVIGIFLSSILTVVMRIVFWVWLRILGVGFADKSNRYFVNVSMTIVEMLPLLNNIIPGWCIGTLVIIRQVEREDMEKQREVAENQVPPLAINDNETTPRKRRRVA